MNATHSFDIGPLTWVKGEIDLALDRAVELLHTADTDASAVSQAAAQLHQAHGALAIVGLNGITQYSEALEKLFANVEAGELDYTPEVAAAAEQGLFTIRHYLDDLVAGNTDQPLKLYPHYRTLLALRGMPEPPASDLFFPDLSMRPPKRDVEPESPDAAELGPYLRTARMNYQRGLLKWLKGSSAGLADMREALDRIEATQNQPARRTLWWTAQGMIDAMRAADGNASNSALRDLNARLDVQIRKLIEGSTAAADRLLRDMLYQVAVAPAGSEHLEFVRAAFQLDQYLPKHDAIAEDETKRPVVAQLRDLVNNAKDDWGRFSAGTAAALPRFHQRIDEACVLAVQFDHEGFTRLVNAISDLAETLRRDPLRQDESVAIEIATALLLAENGITAWPHQAADFSAQIDATVARLEVLKRGESLAELALPQLDDIARKAQERLLMAQVVREISANLATIEQTLDAFFRNPEQKEGLATLKKPLAQVSGALAVLGEEGAQKLLRECELRIRSFETAGELRQEDFEDIARKLSALGFFVDQLRHGPADLNAILNPHGSTGREVAATEISPEQNLRLTQTLIGALRDRPEDSALRDELKQQLETLREDAELIADGELREQVNTAIAALNDDTADAPTLDQAIAPLAASTEIIAPSVDTLRLASSSRETIDAELLGIFLEEARDVLATLTATLPVAERDPHDHETLTTIRRSFHTLKGSGRMVGLNDLGETAWAVEQVMNQWLQQESAGTPALMRMLNDAHAIFTDWVATLEKGDTRNSPDTTALTTTCARLLAGEDVPAPAAGAPGTDPATPVETGGGAKVIEFPSATATVEIGSLSLTPMLFDTYVGEARNHIDAMQTAFAAIDKLPSDALIRAAHTLAGISATVGISPVRALVGALEDALTRYARAAQEISLDDRVVIARAIGAADGMVGAIAGRRMPSHDEALEGALAELAPLDADTPVSPLSVFDPPADWLPEPKVPSAEIEAIDPGNAEPEAPIAAVEATPVELPPSVASGDYALTGAAETLEFRLVEDDIDDQLLPIFMEESADLMQAMGTALRDWRARPDDKEAGERLQRQLHTLKGSARMAGAMTLGELLHAMETRAEHGMQLGVDAHLIDTLDTAYDRAAQMLDRIARGEPALESAVAANATEAADAAPERAEQGGTKRAADATNVLRVRAHLIDDLVNNSGEIAITRARIEGEVRTLKDSLLDLTENVIRLRGQLREIEIQAESQMQSQQSIASEHSATFDPLEFDRFTRFQELTRLMAESVNDVSTIQHTLLRNIENTDAALVAQSRLNRDLSQSLMGVRMVPFDSVADRLYRVVRQASRDSGKRARLDIRGAQTELDRSVLDGMIGPLEHLLRNAVGHGLENAETRRAAGKDETGEILISLAQTGNEVSIVLQDDGGGLDFERIRATGEARGLIEPGAKLDEAALTELIFTPGFSTATEVTALSGRGIGMDVVKSEVQSLGGRIEVATTAGKGSTFSIYLPLTLAVAQGVLVRVGLRTLILPAGMIAQVRELKPADIDTVRQTGSTLWLNETYPYHYLPHLLGNAEAQPEPARRHWLLLLKSGDRQIALEVDALLGNQEVVVKNIGPQLARVPGIVGATVLGDGEIALIVNPVALAVRPRAVPAAAPAPTQSKRAEAVTSLIPTVLVVDDSLTVRKITGRLLERAGYRVVTAKDGIDALEQMVELLPDVMLVDIEMPRMDGFDLTRNIRADERLRQVPIIMITSRTADKHRNYATEIGVNHYLGKPYDEDGLLRLIADFTGAKNTS